MLEILRDPAITGTVIVTVPDEMPVTETIELSERLQAETDVDLAAVVMNRVLPELFGDREEAVFAKMLGSDPQQHLQSVAGSAARRVFEGADLAVRLRRSRAAHITRLREHLDSETLMIFVPETFSRAQGIRATRMIADAIGEEL